MKVKDLIERLKRLDQDAMVLIPDGFTPGFYQETLVTLKNNVKKHSEYELVYVDESYLDKHQTKGELIETVCID